MCGELNRDRRIPMRNVTLFSVTAVGILAGVGAWATSTTQARLEAAPDIRINTDVRIDPLEIMMKYGKDLPTEKFVDNSFVFH
jgi:hypothetical protein